MLSKQAILHQRVHKYFVDSCEGDIKKAIDHFVSENYSRTTIRGIILRFLNRGTTNRKEGSGRKPKILCKKGLDKLKQIFNNKDTCSIREGAKKLNCSANLVKYGLDKLGIATKRKKRSPKFDELSLKEAQRKSGQLVRLFHNVEPILDDESYFSLDDSSSDFYYTMNDENAPDSIKYKQKGKFAPKVLVWIAGSKLGLSEPYIHSSKNAITSDVYIKKCLPKLVKFVEKFHSDGNYCFWPDKASAHYAKATIEFLTSKQVNFVPKDKNPTNVPQCRPIEDFWAILKRRVWRGENKPKDLQSLITRIKREVRKVDSELVQSVFGSTKQRVRESHRNGPLSVIH